MSSQPWIAWYPADYRAKTSHLSFEQSEAYRRLLEAYYESRGKLKNDRPGLYRICRAMTDSEKAAVDQVSDEFFTSENGSLHHQRANEELAVREQHHARLSEAGHRGGLIAGKGRPKKIIGQAQARSQSQSQPQLHPLPQPHPHPASQGKTKKDQKRTTGATPTVATWEAYSTAYFNRYGVEPVPNAKVNSQLAQFVKRLPQQEAPLVAAFYLTHNSPFYVRSRHPVGALLKDAEGLRTQWATGVKATGLEARSAEQGDAAQAQLKRLTGGA